MSPMDLELSQAMPKHKLEVRAHLCVPDMDNMPSRVLLHEDAFVSMLYLERRRAERSRKRFVLVLVDVQGVLSDGQNERKVLALSKALAESTRETDIFGWYMENSLMGIIGTELGEASNQVVQDCFLAKLRKFFGINLSAKKNSAISVSFHFFPEEDRKDNNDHSANITLYPDLQKRQKAKKVSLALKRYIDVVGSSLALVCGAPVFGAIALAIKVTSKGPVLFKQERLGQYGKPFMVLKFRSMRTNCDAQIHQQYVHQFISGQVDHESNSKKKPIYKIQEDPRITVVGKFLRKTSLDELPQFWNVLRGEMSLVGPRPPIAYEYKAYEIWHRRRVLEIKPGITGLWQVQGRSRTRFDDMVRLDLKYARRWSVWLDLKILAQTPAAVIQGDGAH